MTIPSHIFKSYDVRGVYPQDLNEEYVYVIIQGYVKLFSPKKVVVGRDVRESGQSLFDSAVAAFTDAGVNVIDIGVVSTDEYYFAVGELECDGGVTISASHNPREWNGLNFCKKGAEPLSSESGLYDIRDLIAKDETRITSDTKGSVEKVDVADDFIRKAVSFIDVASLKPKKIVANANFGVDVVLLKRAVELFDLPLEIVPQNDKPDGTFPKGPPNPLLPENRKEFLELILESNADFGVSWDADGDRCFFADEKGQFIEGYFSTAIIAKEVLKKHPGSKILIDPRLVWATTDEIERSGGRVIVCRAGMTIIAARMKKEDAAFGGEMSSHFYFRENYYRDNGLIPIFLIWEMMSVQDKKLSELADPYTSKYFITGEINFETEKKDEIIVAAEEKYNDGKIEHIDGLSVEYPEWRFNLRKSNTEPLLRLNLEARSHEEMEKRKVEVLDFIKSRA